MIKKVQNKAINNRTKDHFFLGAFLAIFVVMPILAFLYNQLAGGIFNGLSGYRKEPIIDQNLFLFVINPVCLLLVYFFVYKHMMVHIKNKNMFEKFITFLLFAIVSGITFVGIFWKAFTT